MSGVAQDNQRLGGGPDDASSRHNLCAFVDLPANVWSMKEIHEESPWPQIGKFLDFLGGQEMTTK